MRFLRSVGVLVIVPLLVVGCADRETASSAGPPSSGPEIVVPEVELDAFDPDPCAHVAGPLASGESAYVGLGRAHAVARFFGPALGARIVDGALAEAMEGTEPASAARIEGYARAIGGCVVPLGARGGHSEEVRWLGHLPVVGPWSPVTGVPEKGNVIAFDLRNLADEPGLDAAIEAMVRAYVGVEIARPGGEGRVCRGLPDEVWSVLAGTPTVYGCALETRDDRSLERQGGGSGVYVLTSTRMPPAAARWAIALRLSGAARIIGEHVQGATAEMQTTAVGARALASRVEHATLAGVSLPDLVEADVRTADPEAVLATMPRELPTAPVVTASTRRSLGDGEPLTDRPTEGTATLGAARASIVAAFGVIDRFFPFFAEVGPYPTEILPGLVAGIEKASDPRLGAISALYPLLMPLQDGHAWPVSLAGGETGATGGPSVAVLGIDDRLIVARSVHPEVSAGDELLEVDGASAFDRWTLIRSRVSGSVGHQRAIAASYLVGAETKTITVRTGEGEPRTVSVTPVAKPASAVRMWNRAPGTLADLGAPELFYVSLDDGAIGTTKIEAIAEQMAQAEGVVLDMRGYPGSTGYRLLSLAIPDTSKGPPLFTYETRADGATPTEPQQQRLRDMTSTKQGQVFTGKVVLLVGPDSQSSAEHLSTFFRTSGRGPIIGETTSGANGNITGMQLGCGLAVTFTGMHVTNPDGSRFHGIGLVPDIVSEPTQASLAKGTDVVLLRAIEELRKAD